jgi:Domain of unknown function (DUF1883)./MTH538 TIR-like domain (DUF1863).
LNFAHYDLGQLNAGRVVAVHLKGNAANVRLLDKENYENYIAGAPYSYRGGLMSRSPVRMQITEKAHYHIVIDLLKLGGSVTTSYQLLPSSSAAGGLIYPITSSLGVHEELEVSNKMAERSVLTDDYRSYSRSPAQDNRLEGYTGTDPFIFISYAHSDSDVVYPIIAKISSRDALVWYDEGITPGADWPSTIAERILNCDKFIVFISPGAIESQHVWQEINYANNKQKKIIPIHLVNTEMTAGFEMILSAFQSIFYFEYDNNEEGFYNRLFENF